MKYIKNATILLLSLILLCSCGGRDKEYKIPDCTKAYMNYCGITKFNVAKLGKYDSMKLEKKSVTVTEEEISENISDLLESYAYMEPVEDRDIVNEGDFVNISYDVFCGDEMINTVSGDSLKVGAGYYNKEIETALVNKKTGEAFELPTVDEESGKELLLKIKVDSIQKFITYSLEDTEFLNNVLGYSSVEELKKAVKEQILQSKKAEAKSEAEHNLLKKITDDSEIELDEKEVAEYAKQQVEVYEQIASANNLSLEDYYTQNLKLSKDEFYQKCYNDAEEELSEEIIVGVIAELENIHPQKDISEELSDTSQEEMLQKEVKNQQLLRNRVVENVFN